MHNMAPQPPEIILDLLAITALVGVIALMVSVQQTALLITDWGSLSPSSTKYLATGVTIFATLPTALINGRIQHALLQPLGSRLHRVILDANRSPIRADGGEPESLRCRDGMEAADREWKGALGMTAWRRSSGFLTSSSPSSNLHVLWSPYDGHRHSARRLSSSGESLPLWHKAAP